MIIYVCKGCSARRALVCKYCEGTEFAEERLDLASLENEMVLTQSVTRNLGGGPRDPIGGARVRETSDSALQCEKMAGKDYFTRQGSAIGKCHSNEEAGDSNLCTRPHLPLEQEQLLDSTDIEFYWNEDSEAFSVRSQDAELAEQVLNYVFKNQTASNSLSKENQIFLDQIQTFQSNLIESQRNGNDDGGSRHIPLEQKQPLGNFGEIPSAIKTSWPRIQSAFFETQTQDSDIVIGSNVNYDADSTRLFGANPQHLMKFHDQPSNAEQSNESIIEMNLGNQTTAETSRIENQDDEMNFSSTTPCKTRLPQTVPEKFVIDPNARDTRAGSTDFTKEIFLNRGVLFTDNFALQRGGLSSKKRKMASADNDPAVAVSLAGSSASPTQKQTFECEKCTRKFRDENCFSEHMADHEIYTLNKCEDCPQEFRHVSQRTQHYEAIHKKVWPCLFCHQKSEGRRELFFHLRIKHRLLLSDKELKCNKCLFQLINKSKDGNCVRDSDDDPKAFKCVPCSKPFLCKHALANHYRAVHRRRKTF